jgi:hypothetical protein
LARVVPKSLRAPQCFDIESYFFIWWESWVEIDDLVDPPDRIALPVVSY